MVERYLESAQRWLAPWQARLAQLHAGWCVLTLTAVVVCARHAWVVAARPKQLDEIAATYGSVGLMFGVPQINAAGSRVSYIQQSRVGRTVYAQDLRTGERKEVAEFEETAAMPAHLGVWPWSPDGGTFIYSVGTTLFPWAVDGSVIKAGLNLRGRAVTDLVWLGPDHIVCLVEGQRICQVRLNRGKLDLVANYRPPSRNWELNSLNVVATNAVAWVNSNALWRLELNRTWESNSPTITSLILTNPAPVWLPSPRPKLGELAVSPRFGEALFTGAGERSDQELWRWNLSTNADGMERLAKATTLTQPRWVGADGYAYIAGGKQLRVGRLKDPQSRLIGLAKATSLSAPSAGGQLAIKGISGDDIAEAVWIYDVTNQALKRVEDGTEKLAVKTQRPNVTAGKVTLPNGAQRSFYIVRPIGYDRHARRQYPVVLGNTTFIAGDGLKDWHPNGPLWAEALANTGCFVVAINRGAWMKDIEEWGNSVMALHPLLAENPEMDMSQVFLFGVSAETHYMCKLATERAGLWKGLILMNPGALPKLEDFPLTQPVPKILFSLGDLEGRQEGLKRYQAEAMQRGISVEMAIHKDAGHWLQGQAAVRDRTKAILRFVADQPAQ